MILPVHIIRVIFDYVPESTWHINRYNASKIIRTREKWERLCFDFQRIIYLRRFRVYPNHTSLFEQATTILRKTMELCTLPLYCHPLLSCHIYERSIFLSTFYIQSNYFEPIDISEYMTLQKDLKFYLMRHKKFIWDDRVMDRLNNMYPPWKTLPKYESVSTSRRMKWYKIHIELYSKTPLVM